MFVTKSGAGWQGEREKEREQTIGMNIGMMPVTGIPLPFMSYGGSHILVEFISIGIIGRFALSKRAVHRDKLGSEFDSLE